MPPAAPPATSPLSLFILTYLHPPSTSCCHTEITHRKCRVRSRDKCPSSPLSCDLIDSKRLGERRFFLVNKKPLWTEKEAGEILAVHLLKRKARKQASTHLTRVARLIVSYVCWIIGNRRLDPFVDNHRVTIREYFVLWSCKSSSRGIKRGSTLTRAANCEVNLQFLGYEILKSVAQWRSSLFVFIPAYLATCSVKHDNIDRRENLTISR